MSWNILIVDVEDREQYDRYYDDDGYDNAPNNWMRSNLVVDSPLNLFNSVSKPLFVFFFFTLSSSPELDSFIFCEAGSCNRNGFLEYKK